MLAPVEQGPIGPPTGPNLEVEFYSGSINLGTSRFGRWQSCSISRTTKLSSASGTIGRKEVFGAIFGRPESVRKSFQRLHPIRICTMHARPITQDDQLFLYVEVRRLMKAVS